METGSSLPTTSQLTQQTQTPSITITPPPLLSGTVNVVALDEKVVEKEGKPSRKETRVLAVLEREEAPAKSSIYYIDITHVYRVNKLIKVR